MKNEECRLSPVGEELIDLYFPVLNSGFIALKDYMGTDSSIERAARVSYGKGTRKVSETRDLLRYLLRNKHTSPFEQCELVFHMRLPMDVNRQHVRHRTASLNEYSTRYSEAIDLCETTNPDEWRLQSKDNKQGSKGNITEWPEGWGIFINQENQEHHIEYVPYVTDGKNYFYQIEKNEISPGEYLSVKEKEFHGIARELYEERLKFGMAKEQARKDLPLSTATEMYWKCDLHNLLHYLKLRCDKHAQLEIRSYANIMAGIVKELFPITWDAFEDYTMNAKNFSAYELSLLQDLLLYECSTRENWEKNAGFHYNNLSKREVDEFWAKLSPTDKVDYTLDKTKAKTYDDFKV